MTRFVLAVAFCSALALSAFAAEPQPRPTSGSGGKLGAQPNKKIEISGVERTYKLYAPKALDFKKPVPLVFSFHGLGDGQALMSLYTQLDRLAEKENFVLIYPDGRLHAWPLLPIMAKDDLAFFDALYDLAGKNYNIDQSRVYLVGMSNGAYFSHLVARERSEKVAAIACHSGGLGMMNEEPKLKQKFAVMLIHGDKDSIVNVDESRRARDAYKKWGHDVEYIEVAGLNHFWAHKVKVNQKIWEFFEQHPLAE
jgi:polyhydroxybutyrate depolymerase